MRLDAGRVDCARQSRPKCRVRVLVALQPGWRRLPLIGTGSAAPCIHNNAEAPFRRRDGNDQSRAGYGRLARVERRPRPVSELHPSNWCSSICAWSLALACGLDRVRRLENHSVRERVQEGVCSRASNRAARGCETRPVSLRLSEFRQRARQPRIAVSRLVSPLHVWAGSGHEAWLWCWSVVWCACGCCAEADREPYGDLPDNPRLGQTGGPLWKPGRRWC